MHIERVDAPSCVGGENPLWDARAQALYYIDNSGRKVHRHVPATGASATWEMPAVITTLALRENGGAVVTLRSGVHALDLDTGALECWSPLEEPPRYVFNDGKIDRRGRFLMGASTASGQPPRPDGGLFRLDPDRRLTQLDCGVHYSNSPCWSPDDKTFYFSDSWLYQTYAYDYDIDTGETAGKRVFIDTTELGGRPDGATVDRDGLVWIALYGAGKIAAFRPDGRLERLVETPVKLCSSVMFGGPDLDQLYVTTIAHGALGEPPEEGAGYLYRIDGLGARGLPEPRYAG